MHTIFDVMDLAVIDGDDFSNFSRRLANVNVAAHANSAMESDIPSCTYEMSWEDLQMETLKALIAELKSNDCEVSIPTCPYLTAQVTDWVRT